MKILPTHIIEAIGVYFPINEGRVRFRATDRPGRALPGRISRNLFPIAFSRNAPSDMEFRERAGRLKTGVTEPAAGAAGPGSEAEGCRISGGSAALFGWLHAAPAATRRCHSYLATIMSFLNCGNKE